MANSSSYSEHTPMPQKSQSLISMGTLCLDCQREGFVDRLLFQQDDSESEQNLAISGLSMERHGEIHLLGDCLQM